MPLYDYAILDTQGNRTGEYVRDVFQHIRDDALTEIDGRPVERAVVRTSIQRTWHGKETRSMALHFDPREMASIKADCPSMELDGEGFATFRNDAHLKRVYRELAAAKSRYQNDAPRVDERADTQENDRAAEALSQKFGSASLRWASSRSSVSRSRCTAAASTVASVSPCPTIPT